MKIRPAILIIENDKILTMHYRYAEQDVYNLPGGNVDFGETLIETLVRELREELGLSIAVQDLKLIGEVHIVDKKQQTLHCIFSGTILKGSPRLNASETSALAVKWLAISELDTLKMYPNIGEAIQKFYKNQDNARYIGEIKQTWF